MCVFFWDFDGTLVYAGALWSKSIHKALMETDIYTQVKMDDIRKHMSYGFTWHTPDRDYSDITHEKWWDFMNQHFYKSYINCGVAEQTAAKAVKRVRGIIKRTENYTLYEDATATLVRIRQLGHRNVILSNNYPDLEEVLIKLGLSEYLDGVIVSAVEGYDKPRKELFEIAKKRFPARRYYMIGDSVKADIIGGKNAGMKTILVHKGYSEHADYCFDTLHLIADKWYEYREFCEMG